MARLGEANLEPEALHERRMRAMELRKEGKSYPKIAKALGVSITQAYKDAHYRLEQMIKEETETAEEMRRIELERLDTVLERIWPYLDRELPNIDYTDMFLKIMARRSKLMGLDAVSKVEVTVQDEREKRLSDAELYKKVRALHERLAKAGVKTDPILLERNPFEGDVIEVEAQKVEEKP